MPNDAKCTITKQSAHPIDRRTLGAYHIGSEDTTVAIAELGGFREFLRFLPSVKRTPSAALWLTYDQEADVLYVNFKKPSVTTDKFSSNDRSQAYPTQSV
jgi:hypothetical protein